MEPNRSKIRTKIEFVSILEMGQKYLKMLTKYLIVSFSMLFASDITYLSL